MPDYAGMNDFIAKPADPDKLVHDHSALAERNPERSAQLEQLTSSPLAQSGGKAARSSNSGCSS